MNFTGEIPECTGDLCAFVEHLCDRIDTVEPGIQAMLPEPGRRKRLLSDARRLTAEYPDPAGRPPLFGIPVGIKDLYHADGFETRAGSRLPPEALAGREGPAVKRLKKAGALIVGKTVTTEFAYFSPGLTRNPHNTANTPGGSSSGSAAAVAAGECALALGTQTIGSITRPAGYCGIFGFKPSPGRMATSGIIPFSRRADQPGFFAPDMAGILRGARVLIPRWHKIPPASARLLTLGIPGGAFLAQADETVRSFFEQQLQKLESLGHKIVHLDLFPDIVRINALHRTMTAVDIAKAHARLFRLYEPLYSEATRKLILDGQTADDTGADASMAEVRARMDETMARQGLDLWLTPATTTPAPEGIASTGSPLMNLPFTHAGVPTLAVPMGKTRGGLPLGLQFAGRFGQDEVFLSCMAALP